VLEEMDQRELALADAIVAAMKQALTEGISPEIVFAVVKMASVIFEDAFYRSTARRQEGNP
jgi:hypothetical protein